MNARISSILLGTSLLLASPTDAQTVSWKNPVDGMWSEPSNWDSARVPTASDTVRITLPGTYTVRLGGSGVARCVTIGADSGTQTLSVTPTWYNGVHLDVGGTLTGLPTSRIIIDVGNSGALVVDSTLVNAGTLIVTNSFTTGYQGPVQVKSGTLVNLGTIDVLQGVGGGRHFDATVDNRGVINVDRPLSLTKVSSAHVNSGTINVRTDFSVAQSGSNPSFTNRGTIAIDSGRTFLVEQGTFIHDGGTMSGMGQCRMATVTGFLLSDFSLAIPSWTLTYSSLRGPGTLSIPDGSSLTLLSDTIFSPLDLAGSLHSSLSPYLGSHSYIRGHLATHPSSRISADVGNQCALVFDSAFTNAGTFTAYTSSGGCGAITVRNGRLTNAGTINFPAGGSQSGRTLAAALDNLGTVNVGAPLTIASNAAGLSNTGTIAVRGGNLVITPGGADPTFTNSGAISLGAGNALEVTAGTFRNTTTGLITLEIGGRTVNADLAQVRAIGNARLGGTLNLLLVNNFLPEIDDSLAVVTCYSRTGSFQSIRIPMLNGIPALTAGYAATNVHVKAFIDFANIPELTIGRPLPDSLRSGYYRFYKVYLPQGVSPWFRAGCAAPLLAPQLFVAKGSLPSRSHFDARSTTEMSQSSEIAMSTADSGTYYMLVHNPEPDFAQYTLQVDTLGYMVRRIRVPASGNDGEVTVEILGANLQQGARAYLGRLGQASIPDTANFLVDPLQLNSRFPLEALAEGDWDITVLAPDSTRAFLPRAMTLSRAAAPQLDVALSGPAMIRRDFVGRYVLSATNPSNTNIERALLFIESRPEIEIAARLDSFAVDTALDDPGLTSWVDSTGARFFGLTYFNIAPGRTKNVELFIRPTAYGDYRFFGHIALFSRSNYDTLIVNAYKEAVARGLVDTSTYPRGGSSRPAPGTVTSGILHRTTDEGEDDVAEIRRERRRLQDISKDASGLVSDAMSTLYFPLQKPGPTKLLGLGGILHGMKDLFDKYKRPRFPLPGPESVRSFDPNDIFVPVGNGALKWVQANPLPYRVEFENLADSATAPARFVRVSCRLDPALEPGSLSLGGFGFRNMQFTVPQGLSSHVTRIDLNATLGIFVDVVAILEGDSVVWTFESIDPQTGWPVTDPMRGFLAINDSTGAGRGYVSFTAEPKAQAATGSKIDARAVIVFDDNSPVTTPTKFNTLDRTPPASHVGSLDDSSAAAFDVRWSGSDDGGIASYTIYVSHDGSGFQPWISEISDTAWRFIGAHGSWYGFYSVAVDTAGNVERSKLTAEALTRVVTGVAGDPGVPLTYELYQNYPNPFNPASTIRIALPEAARVVIAVYNILGQRVRTLIDERLEAGYHDIRFDAGRIASGVYLCHMQAGSFTATRKMILMR